MNRMRLNLGGESPAAFLDQVSMCDLWGSPEMLGFSYADVVDEHPGLLPYTLATQQEVFDLSSHPQTKESLVMRFGKPSNHFYLALGSSNFSFGPPCVSINTPSAPCLPKLRYMATPSLSNSNFII
jgi:hypothetical protein